MKLSEDEIKALILAAVRAEKWFTHQEVIDNETLDYEAYQTADDLRGALGVVEEKQPELLKKD
jgi:hypothetical protein